MPLMKFEVLNRWSGAVQFTAEIYCEDGALRSVKLGLAVKWAYRSRAVLSDADLSGADLRDAVLSRAVLSRADLSRADLSRAVLSRAVLSGADLRDAVLSRAVLSRADLRRADLSRAVLSGADLRDAVLSRAVLSDADLSGAEIPVIPNIDAAILDSIEANKKTGTNGLKMNAWHGDEDCDETNWCQTTHCRAGYAICLAGAAGFALQAKIGPAAAGALIYAKSRPDKPVPNFYCDNDTAMEDIRTCAAEQRLTPTNP